MKYSAKAPAPEFVSEMLPFISNASVCVGSLNFLFNEPSRYPGIKPGAVCYIKSLFWVEPNLFRPVAHLASLKINLRRVFSVSETQQS